MLSVLVSARNWPVERVQACVDSFAAVPETIVSEIVFVDFGSDVPIALNAIPRLRQVRLEAKRWSHAEATNAAVLASSSDLLVKTDADMLLSPHSHEGFAASAKQVAAGEFDILLTQNIDLPEGLSVADAARAIRKGELPAGRFRPKWGQGALVFFSRASWARVGGYDSRFTGWGDEDNDFPERLRRSGARLGWVPAKSIQLFHPWHPPTYHQTHVARERQANQRLVREDHTIFRPLRFVNSDVSALASPTVLRRDYPMVTVAIATSERPRRERMIAECIRSFRGQIGGDFEVVAIDNGSSDDSYATLETAIAGLKPVAPIRLERQATQSIPRARNEISRIARGRFICVMDDDDIAFPNRLADHLKCFETDGLAHGSQGGWIDYDEDSGLIEKNGGKRRSIATMLKGTGKSTSHPASFYRTDAMRAVPYDESLVLGSDWDMALRMAALELRIVNTGTYVTLRRFHSANVTLTGTSNQVRTGLLARSRIWGLYNQRHQQELIAAARADNDEFPAANEMSIGDLLDFMPSYAGVWRVTVPFSSLSGQSADGKGARLEAALDITEGDVTTLASGIGMPVLFCSSPIRGARRARRVMSDLMKLTGEIPGVISDRQLALDRTIRFDWGDIMIPPGGAFVLSERVQSLADALEAIGRLPPGSLVQSAMRIVSDFDDDGASYYLMAPPTDSLADAQQMIEVLHARTALRFRFAKSPQLHSVPTVPVDRFH